jgi:aminomethyltransferase
MTVLESVHEDHGATFTERGGRTVVANYGRPERTHRAVRNVVGVTERVSGVIVVEGTDRVEYVDDAVSNSVPEREGDGVDALLLDPDGSIRAELAIFNAGDRLLCVLPPGVTDAVATDWQDKVFLSDVEISVATDQFALFGVHGQKATEKVASVLNKASAPESPRSFVRGTMKDSGVTVIQEDGLTGEEGYLIVCRADDAAEIFDTLVNHGLNAAPFGRDTWETLTLEAGTPLFESELEGRIPNEVGARYALDFEKGCFVGQEVVSRIENRGQPGRKLVGLDVDERPDAGDAVTVDGAEIGQITRAVDSPSLDAPIAFAFVDASHASGDVTVGDGIAASVADLPFVEGSDRSARIPEY